MVWGCVLFDCKNDLVDIQGNMTARCYIDKVPAAPHVETYVDNHALGDRPVYRQDGATPHTARISENFLNQAAIEVMLCPCRSPHLNIVEHIWAHIS